MPEGEGERCRCNPTERRMARQYHRLRTFKYRALGRKYPLENVIAREKEDLSGTIAKFLSLSDIRQLWFKAHMRK
jgi:hypothetical protein